MKTFEEDLKSAIEYHGHLCTGQILGVRMARYGSKMLGIDDPQNYRDLVVYIENDRCLADAIGTVTGCKLGKRRLKWFDYGKSAATFLDLNSKKAYRIRTATHHRPPEGVDLVEYFNAIPDEEMFDIQEVKIDIKPTDLPGKPVAHTICEKCKEDITDGKHITIDGKDYCKACVNGAYYERIGE